MIYPTGLLQSVLRHRSSRVLATLLSVILVIVSSCFVPSLAHTNQTAPPAPVVLVFPFTNNAGPTFNGQSTAIATNVRLKINELGYYRSTGFTVLHPSIQRALNVENTLSEAEVNAPTASPDRAQKIANIVSAPYFLVGNIDSIVTDPDSGTVTVKLDGTFYQSDNLTPIKQANVTGVAAPASKIYDPMAIQSSAIDNASGNLVSTLIGPQFSTQEPSTTIAPSKHRDSGFGAALLIGLAVVLALVIINNHGGHHGSSGNGGNTTSTSSNGGSNGTTTTTSTSSTSTSTTGPPPPP